MKMRIELHNLKPKYMSESEVAGSDIYLQPSVLFEQGCSYLVRARSGHGKTSLLNFIYGISGQYDGEVVLTESGKRKTESGERMVRHTPPLRAPLSERGWLTQERRMSCARGC